MVKAIVGANWGDEGKGKITDMLYLRIIFWIDRLIKRNICIKWCILLSVGSCNRIQNLPVYAHSCKCDFIASIPMKGDIDYLNASVAAGVLAYEIVRQRLNQGVFYEAYGRVS